MHQPLLQTEGDRLREAAAINRSLLTLSQVINRLVEGGHAPFRDSKLTFLLRESLGGNSRTVLCPTISPAVSCFGESLNTLRFAQRAKQIHNKAVVNEDTSLSAVELAAEVQRLKKEVAVLRALQAAAPGAAAEGELAEALEMGRDAQARADGLQEQLGRVRRRERGKESRGR